MTVNNQRLAKPHGALAHGALAPGPLDRAVIAATSRMPDDWLGLRLAILLRRAVTMRLPAGALDVERWGLRLRLHPLDNGCEKNLLFTPQMYEPTEFAALAAEIGRGRGRRPAVRIRRYRSQCGAVLAVCRRACGERGADTRNRARAR